MVRRPAPSGPFTFWEVFDKENKMPILIEPRWSRGIVPHPEEWWGIRRLRQGNPNVTKETRRKPRQRARPRQCGPEETLRRGDPLREKAPGPLRWNRRLDGRAFQDLPQIDEHEDLLAVRRLAPSHQVMVHRLYLPGNCLTELPHLKSK